MSPTHDPSLYQINPRVWLTELSGNVGRTATLDDIPDGELDRLASLGFDWIWFLSVWQTGEWKQIEDGLVAVRNAMTQKYQIEFLVCDQT